MDNYKIFRNIFNAKEPAVSSCDYQLDIQTVFARSPDDVNFKKTAAGSYFIMLRPPHANGKNMNKYVLFEL